MKQGIIKAAAQILDIISKEVFTDTEVNEEDAVIYAIMHSLVKKSEDIQLLLNNKSYNSVENIGRTMLELYVSLKFILSNDTSRRGRSYLYSYKMQIAKKLEDIIAEIPKNQELFKLTEADMVSLSKEVPNVSSLAEYKEYYTEKYNEQFLSNLKKGARKNWYNIDGNISGFRELMEVVGLEKADYYFLYGISSLDVHGISIVGKMSIANGVFEVNDTINLPIINHKITNYLTMGIMEMYKYYKKRCSSQVIREINKKVVQMKLNFQYQNQEDKL